MAASLLRVSMAGRFAGIDARAWDMQRRIAAFLPSLASAAPTADKLAAPAQATMSTTRQASLMRM
jgi:hypothetical protein